MKYFALQLLTQKGITKESVGILEYIQRINDQMELLESDSTKIVSHDFCKHIEILEYQQDGLGNRHISKLRVITTTGSFEIFGYFECLECIARFSELKNIDKDVLLKDPTLVVDLSNAPRESMSDNKQNQASSKNKVNLRIVNAKNFVDKLKSCFTSIVGTITRRAKRKKI